MHDAFTGNYICTLSNVPNGYVQIGPKGEILIYSRKQCPRLGANVELIPTYQALY